MVEPSTNQARIRAFLALSPPAAFRAWYEARLDDLRQRFPQIRWVSAENVHVTLRFLGDVEERLLDAVLEAVRDVVKSLALGEQTLEFGAPGQFGAPRRPRVCWLGFRPGPGLDAIVALRKSVEARVASLGFEPEPRSWTPHLTLGRARAARARPAIGDWMEFVKDSLSDLSTRVDMNVDEVTLYSSELTPKGPIYRSIGRVPLELGV